MPESRQDRIRDIGHQVITLITRSGLSIDEQLLLIKTLESSFCETVATLMAALDKDEHNSC